MNLYIFLIGTLSLLLVGKIHAECPNSNLQIGTSYTHAHIKVENQSSFHGNLGGIQASYQYKPWNNFYGCLRAAWKQGNTDTSSANRNLTYVDVQERIGYTYAPCCNDWSITLFSGIGFRYLGHRLKQKEVPSIKFEYNEFYVPVGFLSQYFFRSCWSLGLNFTWMPQIDSTVEIVPLKGARWILQNALSNVLLELPLTYFFTENKRYSLELKPFYERWKDGHSTAKNARGQKLDLPKNTYNFWGAELNFYFAF